MERLEDLLLLSNSPILVTNTNGSGAGSLDAAIPAGYDLSRARAAYQNGFLGVDVPVATKPASKTVFVQVTEVK